METDRQREGEGIKELFQEDHTQICGEESDLRNAFHQTTANRLLTHNVAALAHVELGGGFVRCIRFFFNRAGR